MRRFLFLVPCPMSYAKTVRLYLSSWIFICLYRPLVAQPEMLVECERYGQQKRILLELGMQIRSTSWTLVLLLNLVAEYSF